MGTVRVTSKAAADVVLRTLVRGSRPPARPRAAGLVLLALVAVVAGGLAVVPDARAGTGTLWMTAALTAVAVALTVLDPLWAWRLLIVLVASADLLYGHHARFGWPWTPGFALAAVPVLAAVGRVSQARVLGGVWLVSVTLSAPTANVRDELVPIAVLLAVPLVFGHLVARLRGTEHDLATVAAHQAVLEERTRIARELHDVVAHHMSMLAVRADSARYRFPELTDDLREEFRSIQDTARDGMTEMRRLLGALRAAPGLPETEPQPGAERIASLVERVRAAGTDIRLDLTGELESLPAGVSLSAYRVVQEALSNAVRHAPGAAVTVAVEVTPGELTILVRDSGAPSAFPGEAPGRAKHGLIGMRERAAALGGRLTTGARPEGGFTVAFTVPLGKET
ncbi:sensor histidine kinase [Amycolatopsis sp. DG1A-15b]|uniref:sensor histidine kinase n=1 Tax=Amycolatopsis sp. DG1A-15b TaxID=3052846 RepID=UPI00255C0FB6|nr:sensor histidine kinase [Amycolatopsis sp. DG1A-15b]WIX90383.1 sensor histidine kinase [Amycolatopsis sp. DG1A-15b]